MKPNGIKLFDSELKILEILWCQGDTKAKELAICMNEQYRWSKTTTYTVLKKCIAKNAITRIEPDFVCHAMLSKEEAQEYSTQELIEKYYNGNTDKLIASLLGKRSMTASEISNLKKMISKLEEGE